MEARERTELEAAVFRTLVQHLREHNEVQNIDLMILAGFCRNCLSKWYKAAAEDRGIAMDDGEAREIIYGMPYAEWKKRYDKEATPEQLAAYAKRQARESADK
ncbi:MAG: deoxycytidine triphosphate deaminase [Gammaproteobacteria bacterium]|nr:deoxycytidine triphosphate deaminase [Gammaproteobacteria bacterium]